MAAEKVVVLDYGKCQALNSLPKMDTDEHEPENVQDNSPITSTASAILCDQEDLSNDMPRALAEAAKTTTHAAANYFTNRGNHFAPILPGAKCCLSEKIRSICKCWTELEGLPSDEHLKRYIHALFCNTLRMTLSKEWGNVTYWDCENLRNALFRMNSRACQALAALLPSPWGGESVLKVIHGSFVPSALDAVYEISKEDHQNACAHVCTEACTREPRNVPRTRVELLCYAGLKHEALRLCLCYHNCPVLSEESFYGLTAFHLLYVAGSIKHLIDEVDNLTCHDGFHLIQLILLEHNNVHPLAECLMQILLVRDLVGPSPYCCTLALMEMWCSLHVKQGTSLEDVEQEVQKLGALATKSAHLYLLVDVLYKQYGRRLLPLYLNLYVHALTIDFNNLEYARQVDCRVAIAELETHMSGIYTKLASLLAAEEDQGLARECELTAFSLEPTIERLTKLRTYASSYPLKWSYHHVVRLVPCSGECHCSEKGLCRRDPAVPPWFMTHVPSGILDSDLKGVSKQLLQDLCILVEGPRCRWLTWNMPWRNLHEICMHYLTTAREFRACTDDRRVGIEARLKRLGPFDSSTIPVYRKGHTSSINLDLRDCLIEQNEKKSATENYNEIGTSTVQGEMQINVSGTSDMKTEPSEITKNVLNGRNDVPEICESLVPVANSAACSTDFTPKQHQTENANVSANCTNILASLDSCHFGCKTNIVEKVELTVTPEGDLQKSSDLRNHLQENGGGSDLKMLQMAHNGSHLVKKPLIQNPAHVNIIKGCNALTESVTSLPSLNCGQQECSLSSSPPPTKHCSPIVSQSQNLAVDALPPSNNELSSVAAFETKHPFSLDTQLTLAQTVRSSVPELIGAPQPTNEAVASCMESLRSLLNPGNLQSPCNELSMRQTEKLPPVTHLTCECLVEDPIDDPNEPKKGVSPPPITLESLIAETLHYSPKKSYETVMASEAPDSTAIHVLHSQPSPVVSSDVTMASAALNTECTSVASTAAVIRQYSAPLMDHLYGKNMLQPFFAEYSPVANPSNTVMAKDSAALSSMSTYTMNSSSVTQNITTAAVGQQQISLAKSHVGPTIGTKSSLPVSTSSSSLNCHRVNITQSSGNIASGSQDVVSSAETEVNISKMDNVSHSGFKQESHPPCIYSQVVSECAGSSCFTPVQLTSGTQAVHTSTSPTQGTLASNLLGFVAQGNISSKSNPVQPYLKADAVSSQVLQRVIPRVNPMRPEQVGQEILQPPPRTAMALSHQPVQAYILQPKMNHMNKTLQLTPVDLMQVQQVAKVAGISHPDISSETKVVLNISKKTITCTPATFNTSTSLGQNSLTALPSQTFVNTSHARSFVSQQTQVTQNVALAKPVASTLLQPMSQSLSQTCAIARLPVARVQCPQARTPIPQYGVFSHPSRPQVLCSSKPNNNNNPVGTLQRQTPTLIPVQSMETYQSQASQNAAVSKHSAPVIQQHTNQSQSQTSVSTSPQSVAMTSALRSPYTSPHSSGTITSQQESNIVTIQPSVTSPLKNRLQLLATPSRLQTRRPFNKPKTDGTPRWTTSYSPHGKMCHHKNGQGKGASVSRGTENTNVSKLNSAANVTSASSMSNNSAASVRCSNFKMGGPSLSGTNLTKPVITPNLTNSSCRPVCAVSSIANTTPNVTSVSDVDTVPVAVLVSSEFTNSLCAQRTSPDTERTAIRPSSLANSAGTGKISFAMVVPPELSNCSGVGRTSSAVNQAMILPTTFTTNADINTFSAVLSPNNINGSNFSTAPTVANYKVIEASCLASSSSVSTTSTTMIANLHSKINSDMDTDSARMTVSSTCSKRLSSDPITTPCLENAIKSTTQSAVTVTITNATSRVGSGTLSLGTATVLTPTAQGKSCAGGATMTAPSLASIGDGSTIRQSCQINNPCNGSVSATDVVTPSFTSSSIVGMVSAGINRTLNSATILNGSVLAAALTSHPTVVLNKLNIQARNVPVVKKCISPAIFSRTLSRSLPVTKLAETQMHPSAAIASKPPSSKQNLIRPAILGKLPSEPQSPSHSSSLSQSSMQDIFRGKDFGSIRSLPKENSLARSTGFCSSTTNLKCGPSVNALVSLTKTHLEVSMEKRAVKSDSSSTSSPSKHVIDSRPSYSEPQSSLLARSHNEPQKCICPICDKILMRKSLRMHLTNIHKDSRNVEFAENRAIPGSRQELSNVFTDAKENSSSCQMEVVKENVQERPPVLVKEVTIPCDSTITPECTSDSQVKTVWRKYDQGVSGVDSKSASETSIKEQNTDSKSSSDDKSTDSTSSGMQSSFMHDMPTSPKSSSDMDDKEESSKKEHSMAATSSETGDNYATRGRVSSRNIKPPQKRSCPCCENISPNSSAKKCRDEKLTRSSTSLRKSVHPKIPRKTRSSGRNDKSH